MTVRDDPNHDSLSPSIEQILTVLKHNQGEGINVGLLDSGVDPSHPAVRGRISRAVTIWSTQGKIHVKELPVEECKDSFGHGTACAGIIADLAPKAEITSIKVLGVANAGSAEVLLEGIKWALDHDIKLINVSLGTTRKEYVIRLFKLMERAYIQDAILVVSKSNVGNNMYPALFSSVISVDRRRIDEKDVFYFSPNDVIEFAARGIGVRTAWLNGQYMEQTGTSFATPHITGIVARLLSYDPNLKPYEIKTILYRIAQFYNQLAEKDETE